MTSNGDEKILRELFRRLRREVDESAPPFSRTWQAAQAHSLNERTWLRRLRLPLSAGALAIVAGLIIVAWLRSGNPVEVSKPTPAGEIAHPAPLPGGVEDPKPRETWVQVRETARPGKAARRKHRIGGDNPLVSVTTLSSWRSPTELLLRSPGEELLKNTPALHEEIDEIKPLLRHRAN